MKFSLDQFKGFSRGMYSTWFYHASSGFLFDCGEGCCLTLGNNIFGINHIFISHGHQDHIAGLVPLLAARNSAKGDNNKELSIYSDPEELRDLIRYIREAFGNFKYKLNFIPLYKEETFNIKGLKVKNFRTQHHNGISFGYEVLSSRLKLKKEFLGLPVNEIIELKKTQNIQDEITVSEFAYSGDTIPNLVPDTRVLFHECTFYNKDDVKYNGHTCLDDLNISSSVEELVLYHHSSRYALEYALEKIKNRKWSCNVSIWYDDKLIKAI